MTFDTLYQARHRQVLSRLERFVGKNDAPDVAQHVWLQVAQHLQDFRGDAQLSTWLWVVTRNSAFSYLRRRAIKLARLCDPLDYALGVQSPAIGPEDAAILSEQRRELQRRIRRLSPEYQAVTLAYLAGERAKRTGKALGVPHTTIKSRAHRARLEILGRHTVSDRAFS